MYTSKEINDNHVRNKVAGKKSEMLCYASMSWTWRFLALNEKDFLDELDIGN